MQDRYNSIAEETEILEREVAAQKAQVNATLSQIADRTSPNNLIEDASTYVEERLGQVSGSVINWLERYPLVAIGAGAALLIAVGQQASQKNSNASGYTAYDSLDTGTSRTENLRENVKSFGRSVSQSVGETAENIKRTAQEQAHAVREHAANFGSSVSHNSRNGVEQMKNSGQGVSQQMQTFLHEKPLAAGLIGVAIGAAFAALIPASRQEQAFAEQSLEKLQQKQAEQSNESNTSSQANTSGQSSASSQANYQGAELRNRV